MTESIERTRTTKSQMLQPKEDGSADSDDSNAESDGDGNDSGPPKSKRGAKRRVIDETLLDGEEARRLESRRAYNRQCAAKARKRSKDLISTLQQQVETLSKDKASLERTNEVMKAQLHLLEQQNRSLLLSQRTNNSSLVQSLTGSSQFLGGNQAFAGQTGASFPPSVLDSLSIQSRLPGFQPNESQQVFLSRNPTGAIGGNVPFDQSKYFLG